MGGSEQLINETTCRTAIVRVTLSGANYRLAHDACHTAALLWNQAVDSVYAEWKAQRSPSRYEIQSFLTSLPLQDRPLHAHTTEIIARDLGKVGHWLSIVQSRLRSRPGHYGGIFQPTGPGSAAPTIGVGLPSGPLSIRACGSPAHGFPTSFILRHAQSGSVWFH